MIKILVAEDDEKLNYIVCTFLNDNGYLAISCKDAIEAFDRMEEETVDMIITDVMMPEMDGFEFSAAVRKHDKKIPILFLTARDDIASKQKGYHIGIDDYLVKPIEMEELILHVSALLRRASIANEKKLVAGSLVLNEEETTAYLDGKEIPLTVREFNILFKLLSYPKRTFTRTQLMDEFWGFDSESNPRTVDVSITKLRDKLADCKDAEIITVRGLGYKAVLK
ncbi:DNA-binding response regulator, OmpR family, contains REC and winged-helix (wHTH) domain [Anaerocolumna jejuensis DSM 15929]|uniref:Heme response regulator HssR n=1 Tax=Anaerocolumna jejuensis DSM 15929 TaxID=1121322 RepID=A0A1M6NWD0_9FIRM|nr:response regulator transcription factor [Anaerocolumna jejuensis]SHJ99958.1 DNA-binding response regulator, OmpR family, contains REC and winged-helix (wHTH) domain [Anaerocolumna jejuensis DSM 15929]